MASKKKQPARRRNRGRVTSRYEYCDAAGNVMFTVARYTPKGIHGAVGVARPFLENSVPLAGVIVFGPGTGRFRPRRRKGRRPTLARGADCNLQRIRRRARHVDSGPLQISAAA